MEESFSNLHESNNNIDIVQAQPQPNDQEINRPLSSLPQVSRNDSSHNTGPAVATVNLITPEKKKPQAPRPKLASKDGIRLVRPQPISMLPPQAMVKRWNVPDDPRMGVVMFRGGLNLEKVDKRCETLFSDYGYVGVEKVGESFWFVRLSHVGVSQAINKKFRIGKQQCLTMSAAGHHTFCTSGTQRVQTSQVINAIANVFDATFTLKRTSDASKLMVEFTTPVPTAEFTITVSQNGQTLNIPFMFSLMEPCERCRKTHPAAAGCEPYTNVRMPNGGIQNYVNESRSS